MTTPNACLLNAMKSFQIVAEELKKASENLKDVENKADKVCTELLETKQQIGLISLHADEMIALFHGSAGRALIKLQSYLMLCQKSKMQREMATDVLKMANEFDATTLEKLRTAILTLQTDCEKIKSSLAVDHKNLPRVSGRGQAAAVGGGVFLGAGIVGLAAGTAVFGEVGSIVVAGAVIASTATGVIALALACTAVLGLAAWRLVKYYEKHKQSKVASALKSAVAHCQTALDMLKELKDTVHTATIHVKLAKDTLNNLSDCGTETDGLNDDDFNIFMLDQLQGAIQEMSKIKAALAPKAPPKNATYKTAVAGGAVAVAGAVVGAVALHSGC